MYKNILFDWDGCLARTLDLWVEVCSEALRQHGITASEQEVWKGISKGRLATYLEVPDKQAFRDSVTTLLLSRSDVELYSGVRDFLQTNQQMKKFAIVSNTRTQALHRDLHCHRLDGYFEVIIDDAQAVRPKPSPEGIQKAMQLLGARAEETIMVGDSWIDITAAHRAGVASALFYPDVHRDRYQLMDLLAYQPSHVVRDFSELATIVA